MDKAKMVGGVSALAVLVGSATAGVVAADSVADFSGVQGQGGWHYGWYNLEDLSVGDAGVSTSTASFNQFAHYDSGTGWWAIDPHSASGDQGGGATPGSYAVITATKMHGNAPFPAGNVVAEEQWAARRWISDIAGTLTLQGHIAHDDYQQPMVGNGSEAHILVDGVSVYSFDVAFQDFVGTNFDFDIAVSEGSVIDFVLGAKGDPLFDATVFTARMTTTVPTPGALALLGAGGLLTARRRR